MKNASLPWLWVITNLSKSSRIVFRVRFHASHTRPVFFFFFLFFFSLSLLLPSSFPCVRSTEVSYCWQWYPFKKGGGRWSRPRDLAKGPSARLHLSLRKRLRPRLPFLSNVFPPSGEINSLLGCSAGNLVDRASALRITGEEFLWR